MLTAISMSAIATNGVVPGIEKSVFCQPGNYKYPIYVLNNIYH